MLSRPYWSKTMARIVVAFLLVIIFVSVGSSFNSSGNNDSTTSSFLFEDVKRFILSFSSFNTLQYFIKKCQRRSYFFFRKFFKDVKNMIPTQPVCSCGVSIPSHSAKLCANCLLKPYCSKGCQTARSFPTCAMYFSRRWITAALVV